MSTRGFFLRSLTFLPEDQEQKNFKKHEVLEMMCFQNATHTWKMKENN